jgi:glycosyl transferase family 87
VAVLGVLLLIGAAFSVKVRPDAEAYWLAAQRLREGSSLYGGPRGDETQIYRYAPWFAYAWLPLTYLAHDAAFAVWRGILLAASLGAIWPLLRRPTLASVTLAVLFGGLLVSALPPANATPLIVGALVVGLRTRIGPVLLGLGGSLKVFPLLFVSGYLAERRWLHAAVAIGVAAILWVHVLAFDVGLFAQIGGPSFYVGGVSLIGVSILLWLPVAIACLLAAGVLVVRRSPWIWLAAGAAIPLAVPRVWLPDAAYLLPGAIMLMRAIEDGRRQRVGNRP